MVVVRRLIIITGWVLLGGHHHRGGHCTSDGDTITPEGTSTSQVSPAGAVAKVVLGSVCTSETECTDRITHSRCAGSEGHKKCDCLENYVKMDDTECLLKVPINGTCEKKQQCPSNADCKKEVCACSATHYKTATHSNGTLYCAYLSGGQKDDAKKYPSSSEVYVDPTMLGVLVGLMVMFIVMCVVLRMFSKARFRDQRTVFNSPRMMKISLAKTRAERRPSHAGVGGSRAGSRAGSRHPSIQSGLNMNQKSPTGSTKGSRESLTIANSNLKPAAPLAKDDDSIKVDSPKSPKDPSSAVTINVPENTITAV